MSPAEAVVLGIGLLVVLAGLAWTYRYTASPKAAERMAEADRRYQPPPEPDDDVFDWPFAAKVFGAVLALRLLLMFADITWAWIASPALWTFAIMGWRVKNKNGYDQADDPQTANGRRNRSARPDS